MKRFPGLLFSFGVLALLAVFLSTAQASDGTMPDQPQGGGPPWYHEDWKYRLPLTIHSSAALDRYQVLIRLDSSNFPSFDLTKPDGTDIRFTHSDGTTELNYWIESWSSTQQLAYVWVRVPAVAIGDTTIYLYYHNLGAQSASNGATTFEGFDDTWNQFVGEKQSLEEASNMPLVTGQVESPFTWSVLMGIPEVSPAGILKLVSGTGIRSTTTYQYQAVGYRANFGLGTGHAWAGFINGSSGQRVMIGDLPEDPDGMYLINYVNAFSTALLAGANDWHNTYHTYETRWAAGWSEADVDHSASSASSVEQVPTTSLPVTLFSYSGSNATLSVDWVYVRQYHRPEPSFDVGTPQGLVELGVDTTDSPDPVRTGQQLSYTLSIQNRSDIAAPGVLVTDTLPANVQLVQVNPSQGSCVPGSIVRCTLETLVGNSVASITVIVTPHADGLITNTVMMDSAGYELDMSDNTSDEVTLVDSVPPVVNWERPVHSGGTYYTFGGLVTLEASASDNDQVAAVEFIYWDHNNNQWISIGSDDDYPYQVPFNSSVLIADELYQMFVKAFDRAGNASNPYNPPQVIYMIRRLPVFLPLIHK